MTRNTEMPLAYEGTKIDLAAHTAIARATEAVCAELGLRDRNSVRRAEIESRISSTFMAGHRLPLNLVSAGLDAVGV